MTSRSPSQSLRKVQCLWGPLTFYFWDPDPHGNSFSSSGFGAEGLHSTCDKEHKPGLCRRMGDWWALGVARQIGEESWSIRLPRPISEDLKRPDKERARSKRLSAKKRQNESISKYWFEWVPTEPPLLVQAQKSIQISGGRTQYGRKSLDDRAGTFYLLKICCLRQSRDLSDHSVETLMMSHGRIIFEPTNAEGI